LEHIEVFKVLRTSCWSFVLLLVKRQAYETFSLLDFDFFFRFCLLHWIKIIREGGTSRTIKSSHSRQSGAFTFSSYKQLFISRKYFSTSKII
jgi:hypothetical protein